MDTTIPREDIAERLAMLKDSELDCLVALGDVAGELAALDLRTTSLVAALKTVRAEIWMLERLAS